MGIVHVQDGGWRSLGAENDMYTEAKRQKKRSMLESIESVF